jgi:hypothetical protein
MTKGVIMESASRHGISTKIGLFGASLGVIVPVIGQLADATEPLGVDPVVWIKGAAALAALVILSKAGQAIAAIWTGGSAVVIDAPEPDDLIPSEGDPA